MKKLSVILSILAAIAGLVGIYFAVVEFLKRKGCFSDEEEFEDCCDCGCDEDMGSMEEEDEDSMSFNDDEISFMGDEDNCEEEDEKEPKE